MGIRRVSDLTSVKQIYELGRTYGDRKPHDRNYPKLKDGSLGEVDPRQQRVQNREDRPASHNDVREGWLRGNSRPPHFDPGPSGRRFGRRSEGGR